MPISVTGTTVVFGTPVATTGVMVGAIYAVTPSVALVTSQTSAAAIYAECFTVSGSTATKNSNISVASGTDNYIVEQIGSRWAIVAYNSTLVSANIISVTGTIPSKSAITLMTGAAAFPANSLSYHKIGSQLIVAAYQGNKIYVNVLTDNAGTAVGGTTVVIGGGTSGNAFYYVGGNSTEGWWRNQKNASEHYGVKITISGNNAVVSSLWRSQFSTNNFSAVTNASYLNGTPQAGESTLMFSSNRAIYPGPSLMTSGIQVGVEKGVISFQNTSLMQNSYSKMLSDSEVWVVAPTEETGSGAGTSTKFFVQKARVV
jgi:hypothetical protein